VSTITLTELRKKTGKRWLTAARTDGWVVTAKGRPVAILTPTSADALPATLAALRSARALQAMSALQETAETNGTARLSMTDIDAEIAAARRARRK
jgi:antitoxin (DNA-binding transcriptional repressor) of toxin-antitoxin stability system